MRLKTGRISSDRRAAVTSASVLAASWASLLSEKPRDFKLWNVALSAGSPFSFTQFSAPTISAIWVRNQGSHLVTLWMSGRLIPARIACAIRKMRSGVCPAIQPRKLSSPRVPSTIGISISSRPLKPVSSERKAF